MKFNRKSLNQRGFVHHFILPVIVIVVIAIVGVFVLRKSHAATPPSDSTATVQHYSTQPKGFPGIAVKANQTLANNANALSNNLYYMYVSQYQPVNATGMAVSMSQPSPRVSTTDYHSLAEVAVEAPGSNGSVQSIVEFGWIVAKDVNGDSLPHLFVYHWIDGAPTCYNGCGYVQVSSGMAPGSPVTIGQTGRYEIQSSQGKWWIIYNGVKLGYFPQSLWPVSFNQMTYYQTFGEVAVGSLTPCTQMGNGVFGNQANSARIGNITLTGTSTKPALNLNQTNPTFYKYGAAATSFGFGGPGGACK